MGQKVNPNGIRLGYIRDWRSTWYADSSRYATKLNEDIKVREFCIKNLQQQQLVRFRLRDLLKMLKLQFIQLDLVL